MSEQRRPAGLGALFVIAIGAWLFLQVSVGDLVGRLQSYLPGGAAPENEGEQGLAFSAGGRTLRKRFVAYMRRQVGQEYQWGGTSRKTGFDCSGIIYAWCQKNGLGNVPRTSTAQIAHAKKISMQRAAFTAGAVFHFPGHIAVSAGDGVHTYEARGEAFGVQKAKIAGRGFTSAGIFPEFMLTGGSSGIGSSAGVTKPRPRRSQPRPVLIDHSRVRS